LKYQEERPVKRNNEIIIIIIIIIIIRAQWVWEM